ncbi:MAG: hypothetical protein AMXMBFR23_03210 [Chloroflexota bacterium]
MSTGNTLVGIGLAGGALAGGVYLFRNARTGAVQEDALATIRGALGNLTALVSDLIATTPAGPGPSQSAGVAPGAAVTYQPTPVANDPTGTVFLSGAPLPNPTVWDPTPTPGTAGVYPQPLTEEAALAQSAATGTAIAPPGVTEPGFLAALMRAALGIK